MSPVERALREALEFADAEHKRLSVLAEASEFDQRYRYQSMAGIALRIGDKLRAALSQPPAPPRDPSLEELAVSWANAAVDLDYAYADEEANSVTPEAAEDAQDRIRACHDRAEELRHAYHKAMLKSHRTPRGAGEGEQGVEARVGWIHGRAVMPALRDELTESGFKEGDLVRVVLVKRKEGA